MENSHYKNENIEIKYLNNMHKNRFLRAKNKSFRSRKRFYKIERPIIKRKGSKN